MYDESILCTKNHALQCIFCTENRLKEKLGLSLILYSYARATEWWLNHGNWSKGTKVSPLFAQAILILCAVWRSKVPLIIAL